MIKPKIFYGYWIIVAAFIVLNVSTGCTLVGFSFFVTPLETAMGWSRTEIMFSFTLLWIFTAIGGLFAGRLVDRYGARLVISLGAVLTAAGYFLLSQMANLWHYYVAFAIIGIGMSTIGHIPASYVVSRWFYKRRGLALGVMTMGMSIAAVIYAPLIGVCLIPNLEWQGAYMALAILTAALILPLSIFVIRNSPADKGMFPDGAAAPPEPEISAATARVSGTGVWTVAKVLATPTFWMLAVAMVCAHISIGVMQNQVAHFNDLGFPVSVAALANMVFSISGVTGTFSFGWLCDRMPAKYVWAIAMIIIAIGISVFISINEASPFWLVTIYAVFFGFGCGGYFPVMSMLASTYFGMASYGVAYGMLSFSQATGASIGPLFAGFIYDTLGSYQIAFIIFLATTVLSGIITMLAPRPRLKHN